MGIEPPFLYDHPSKYTFGAPSEKSFNPRAVTQASWAPKPTKPKQNGPLINAKEFERHPDSYFVVLVALQGGVRPCIDRVQALWESQLETYESWDKEESQMGQSRPATPSYRGPFGGNRHASLRHRHQECLWEHRMDIEDTTRNRHYTYHLRNLSSGSLFQSSNTSFLGKLYDLCCSHRHRSYPIFCLHRIDSTDRIHGAIKYPRSLEDIIWR